MVGNKTDFTIKLTADIFRNAGYFKDKRPVNRDPIEIALERLHGKTLKGDYNYSIGTYMITFMNKNELPEFINKSFTYMIASPENAWKGYTYADFLADRAVANLNDFSPHVIVRKIRLHYIPEIIF